MRTQLLTAICGLALTLSASAQGPIYASMRVSAASEKAKLTAKLRKTPITVTSIPAAPGLAALTDAPEALSSATVRIVPLPGTTVDIVVIRRGGFDPDADGDGHLTSADFTAFLQRYAAHDIYAEADGGTKYPWFNTADFTAFLRSYARGRVWPARVTKGTPFLAMHTWQECKCPIPGTGNDCNACPNLDTPWWAGSDIWALTVSPDAQGVVELICDYPAMICTRQEIVSGHGTELWWHWDFVWPSGTAPDYPPADIHNPN